MTQRASRFDRVVRCSAGHLFTTMWVRLGSFKSVRLGWRRRFQRCPVGHHWAMVEPVDETRVPEDELAEARRRHDVRIP